jgi:transcription-repair coupling factor (superfamily II helicase)
MAWCADEVAAARFLKEAPNIVRSTTLRRFGGPFPYRETEDQLTRSSRMGDLSIRRARWNRQFCGDVGSANEVALRAAFCAMNGKQVHRVPTTLLARQHPTFIERFRGCRSSSPGSASCPRRAEEGQGGHRRTGSTSWSARMPFSARP